MKKTIIAAIICMLFALVPMQPTEMTLNILYGVIGVVFSVGMSLIIALNSTNIVNPDLKVQLRGNMHKVRNNFLFIFFFCSLYYIGFSFLKDEWKQIDIVKNENMHFYCSWSLSVLSFFFFFFFAFISNYIPI